MQFFHDASQIPPTISEYKTEINKINTQKRCRAVLCKKPASDNPFELLLQNSSKRYCKPSQKCNPQDYQWWSDWLSQGQIHWWKYKITWWHNKSHWDLNNIPGLLLFLTFEKAFDTVEWPSIWKTLDSFFSDHPLQIGSCFAIRI